MTKKSTAFLIPLVVILQHDDNDSGLKEAELFAGRMLRATVRTTRKAAKDVGMFDRAMDPDAPSVLVAGVSSSDDLEKDLAERTQDLRVARPPVT